MFGTIRHDTPRFALHRFMASRLHGARSRSTKTILIPQASFALSQTCICVLLTHPLHQLPLNHATALLHGHCNPARLASTADRSFYLRYLTKVKMIECSNTELRLLRAHTTTTTEGFSNGNKAHVSILQKPSTNCQLWHLLPQIILHFEYPSLLVSILPSSLSIN